MATLARMALIDWMAVLCLLALCGLAGAAETGILGQHKRAAGFSMLGLVCVFILVLATSRLEDSMLFGNWEQPKEEAGDGKRGQRGHVKMKRGGGGAADADGDGSGPGDGSGGADHTANGGGGGKPNEGAAQAAAGKAGEKAGEEDDHCGDGTGGKVKGSNKKANEQASLPAVRAGAAHQDCPHCPRLAYIPRGCFDMGAQPNEDGAREEETPITRIKLRRPFYIGRYEVTRGEFAAFVNETGFKPSSSCVVDHKWSADHNWLEPGFKQDPNHPVVCVSWLDAMAYVEWLSQVTGQAYRLPTEAEWEYAARGGSKNLYPHSNTLQPADANFDNTVASTLPVGQFSPNAYGLLDMAGNVWELVQDCWEPGYQTMGDSGAARERGDCDRRTMRGGAWYNAGNYLRVSSRWSNPTTAAGNGVGFRVARDITARIATSAKPKIAAPVAPAAAVQPTAQGQPPTAAAASAPGPGVVAGSAGAAAATPAAAAPGVSAASGATGKGAPGAVDGKSAGGAPGGQAKEPTAARKQRERDR